MISFQTCLHTFQYAISSFLSARGLLSCPIVVVLTSATNFFNVICVLADSEPTSTAATLSTGAAVGITAVVTALIALFVGGLIGALLFYCISKHLSQRSKPELSSHQQQQAVVPQQRAGPEYEEVVELKENQAYGPVQNIELKACEAYVPVQH